MPLRLCLEPRCPRPAAPGKSRCVIHAAEQRKGNRSANDSFYSSRPWRMSRRRQLYEHPLCQYVEDGEECGLVADTVHHITPSGRAGRKGRRETCSASAVDITRSSTRSGVCTASWSGGRVFVPNERAEKAPGDSLHRKPQISRENREIYRGRKPSHDRWHPYR
jgi:hypothetical protein